jgi:hypothetical protein
MRKAIAPILTTIMLAVSAATTIEKRELDRVITQA